MVFSALKAVDAKRDASNIPIFMVWFNAKCCFDIWSRFIVPCLLTKCLQQRDIDKFMGSFYKLLYAIIISRCILWYFFFHSCLNRRFVGVSRSFDQI